MSAEIIDLVSRARVDEAWNRYVEYAREVIDDPRLLLDRKFQEEYTRRRERRTHLFLAMEQRS